jgi:predicted RNase H-like HicB family nuclease
VSELLGVMAYGISPADAMANAEVLAPRVISEQLEDGESQPTSIRFSLPLSA